jgi:HD-GYP domain-containing protein (c-di-GMP phosphodiesterase class II)
MPISSAPAEIIMGLSSQLDALAIALKQNGFCVQRSTDLSWLNNNTAALIADPQLLQYGSLLRDRACDALLLAPAAWTADADLELPEDLALPACLKAVEHACQHWLLRHKSRQLKHELEHEREARQDLTEIGIALSAENNLDRLLRLILTEGGKLACCDAGSLFLIDHSDPKQSQLIFKLAFNDSINFQFEEQRFPLNMASLAGYVALTGQELNIDDVYLLAEDAPYRFNADFDRVSGYRTVSMLVLPMKDHLGHMIGVLQFVNRKFRKIPLFNPKQAQQECRAFDPETASLLRALAGQSAVAINNSMLLQNINQLFEGFVSASVMAIEQRDPVTSGHSFRVAQLTTGIAESVNRCGLPQLRHLSYDETDLRELRYAALLHDFGKVGVKEEILQKPCKLTQTNLERIRYRIALQRERTEKIYYQRLLELHQQGHLEEARVSLSLQQQNLQQELRRLDRYLEAILRANEPSILPEGEFEHLKEIAHYQVTDFDGQASELLSHKDFLALSVRRGSLTVEERDQIQSHVMHTFNFLRCIPWTNELKKVPGIAAAHHEKLDGSGYPFGLKGDAIPFEARMMAIADIFDALTASDRPYKKAMPTERALGVLEQEVSTGQLDKDALQVFIEAKVYELVVPPLKS